MKLGSFHSSFVNSVVKVAVGVATTFDFDWPRMCGLSSASSEISPSGCRRSEEAEEVNGMGDGCSMHAEVSADSVSSVGVAKDKTVS